ncbi:MAG: hypothetical protein C4547_16180 [Phycisphaerales bacterium]|nr:MAG: hypothetical protein C4547_16180 [Phycisphaerales bacterium]
MAAIRQIKELPGDPIGGASGGKTFFDVRFLGKTSSPEFPYTVANEVVATQIGMSLGLNLPTVITHTVGGTTVALIQWMDRDPSMQEPPLATAAALRDYVADHPDEVHGARIFDLFIANNDRAFGPMRRNLLLGDDGRLLLYDHGDACLYRPRPDANIRAGIPRLDAVESELPAMFDMDHKGNHYREFLTDWKLVDRWCERIRLLPEYLIRAAVARIPESSPQPDADERQRLVKFLIARRGYLLEHRVRWQVCFPGLPRRGGGVA